MTPQAKYLSAAVIGIVAIAGGASAFLWHQATVPTELATGLALSPTRALPDFSLIDYNGRGFGTQNLRGHWSMLFFGYTNCPDLCPTTLTVLAALEKRLHAERAAVSPQVIFISVDANRDTPAQLKKYVPYFDPDFIGITAADQPAIEAVAAKLGVGIIVSRKADGTYTVDHSSEIFVIDPEGKLAAILTGPFSVDALASDFGRLVAGRV